MRRFLLPLAAAFLALPIFAAGAALPKADAIDAGAAYIRSLQQPDGGYASSPGQSMDAIYALRSAGYDPAKDSVGGVTPVDYLKANAAALTSPGAAAKGALAAKALGLDPKAVNGVDLPGVVAAAYDPDTGAYAGDDFSQSIAMIGLACTGNPVEAKAIDALRATQVETEGGWGFGGGSDPDTTAIAIQALVATGVPTADPALVKALAYVKASQGNDGGWGFDPSESNASSTAYVVQALIALGEDPEASAWAKDGVTPIAFLLGQQNADGSFKGFDPAYATNQALPALAGRTFCDAPQAPVTRVAPAATPTAVPTATTAPRPPSTGNTLAGNGGGRELPIALGLIVLLAGGATVAATRRRG
ncbi:MAG: terpene cyclase/mutase family protein [Dehalococcoidia bacterium]|nr:terpene cyclase/mutase family protein [Dehalococcoidia bacterium]